MLMTSQNLLPWLIPLPPLLGFVIILFLTKKSNRLSHNVALLGAGLSFVASMIVFAKAVSTPGLAATPFTFLCCLDGADDFCLQHRLP